jgi:hypothetical protein
MLATPASAGDADPLGAVRVRHHPALVPPRLVDDGAHLVGPVLRHARPRPPSLSTPPVAHTLITSAPYFTW